MRMLTILAVAVATFPANSLPAAELAPHEADYKVTLVRFLGPGNVESFEGAVKFRLSRDCQKWKLESESTYNLSWNGQYQEMRVSEKQYEALDGTRMEFDVRLEVDGDLKKQFKGSASLEGPGKPGIVKYRMPRRESVGLPAGTVFPIAWTNAVAGRLAAGKKRWTLPVFYTGEIAEISSSVTKSGVAASATPAGDTDLISGSGWLVRTRLVNQQPDSAGMEMELTIHGNGVISAGVIYEELWITRQDLVRIERLPAPQC